MCTPVCVGLGKEWSGKSIPEKHPPEDQGRSTIHHFDMFSQNS